MISPEESSTATFPVFKKRNVTGQPLRKRRRVDGDEDKPSTESTSALVRIPDSMTTVEDSHSDEHEAITVDEEPEAVVRRPEPRTKPRGVDMGILKAGPVPVMESSAPL